jgi:hypothetical protein
MSMCPRALPEVPEQTVAVARTAFPFRNAGDADPGRVRCGVLRRALLDAFGVRGRPGISPGQLAMVTVLQFAENLTGRPAADAVRGRIDWKYLLGLELTDPGCLVDPRAGPCSLARATASAILPHAACFGRGGLNQPRCRAQPRARNVTSSAV